jgi:hypothetical protein
MRSAIRTMMMLIFSKTDLILFFTYYIYTISATCYSFFFGSGIRPGTTTKIAISRLKVAKTLFPGTLSPCFQRQSLNAGP